MTDGVHQAAEILVQICAEKGVREFVIAPGSRSAPLTIALARYPGLQLRVVYDERSAGYMALGLAQQLGRPVGLVCTSGTAAVNFGPAVVEAYYQGVPLLVLTADRPPEWIDQQDNQAIHQPDLYGRHVRASYTLPVDDGHPDTRWFVARVAAQAIDLAQGRERGPVHINVPLREPLYPPVDHQSAFDPALRPIQVAPARLRLEETAWAPLLAAWHNAERKLIIAGMHPVDKRLRTALGRLDPTVAVFADITANLHGVACAPPHAETIVATRDAATLDALRPDLVLHFGGQVTSKALKQLLRKGTAQALWHVRPALIAPDTYQQLSQVIPMAPTDFFEELAARALPAAPSGEYGAHWQTLEHQAALTLERLLARAPFGELTVVAKVLKALPDNAGLQLGNSMPIRYANLLGVQPGPFPTTINANRGASGIDGTVSTAVGAALAAPTRPTVLLVGDLGFFYDRNGLWHAHVPPNLRIVLLNNHGGGIFDIIEGPDRLPAEQRAAYFLTPQPLTARRTAADHGLDYFHAATQDTLATVLPAFFAAPGPALLEVETDMAVNTAVYREFKRVAGEIHLGV